jgi:hypothetical protein
MANGMYAPCHELPFCSCIKATGDEGPQRLQCEKVVPGVTRERLNVPSFNSKKFQTEKQNSDLECCVSNSAHLTFEE